MPKAQITNYVDRKPTRLPDMELVAVPLRGDKLIISHNGEDFAYIVQGVFYGDLNRLHITTSDGPAPLAGVL